MGINTEHMKNAMPASHEYNEHIKKVRDDSLTANTKNIDEISQKQPEAIKTTALNLFKDFFIE